MFSCLNAYFPWVLYLVTVGHVSMQAAQRVSRILNFVNTVCEGECFAAIQTLFSSECKLSVSYLSKYLSS